MTSQAPRGASRSSCRRLAGASALGLAVALAAAGCGGHPVVAAAPAPQPSTAAVSPVPTDPAPPAPPQPAITPVPSPSAVTHAPSSRPAPPRPAGVHFSTPQAAMRYLAAAYNRGDIVALKHVTTPDARAALLALRQEAINFRLESCTRQPIGDYRCEFSHDFPPSRHLPGHGHATFLAAPADKPGWYMTVLVDCD
jgi:hypothetical protein